MGTLVLGRMELLGYLWHVVYHPQKIHLDCYYNLIPRWMLGKEGGSRLDERQSRQEANFIVNLIENLIEKLN